MNATTHDYVIVGGGTAGAILAARLTDDPGVSVLVLESGRDYRGLPIHIPAAAVLLYQKGRYHWGFRSEPEAGLDGRTLPYKVGRILGGSSSINGLVWVRGSPADFDGWAAMGCDGWAWSDVEPLYRRIEDFEDPADPAMGHGGPVAVVRGDTVKGPLNRAFLAAAAEAGLPFNPNCNGPDQLGVCALQRNTRGGERSDIYRGYLKPVLGRPNLTVLCGATAERIVLADRRATAVRYRRDGEAAEARAAREVLLCAGALASPQLLQLSGIGDPADLEPHGIAALHALPGVGRNLHTHPTAKLVFALKQPVSMAPATRFPGKWLAGLEWLLRRTGPAASNHMEVGGFVKTRPELDRPDVQLTLVPIAFGTSYDDGMGHGFEIYMELIGCMSRGRVTIASADPAVPPRFSFNYFDDPRDLAAFRAGTRLIREIAAQPAFAALNGGETSPGPDVTSDSGLDAWLRQTTGVTHHIVGSCRMGPSDDPMAVVGPDLRVHGIDGLRVVDASIMPRVTAGNTHAPVAMIGERAADIIRSGTGRGGQA